MLSRSDYEGYLRELAAIEHSMAELYKRCEALLAGSAEAETCAVLVGQEEEHARLLDELRELFKTR